MPTPFDETPTPHAIILAAGGGSRLGLDHPKCLVPIAGDALLTHQLRALMSAGVRHVAIVVGYQAARVREHIDALALPELSVTFLVNEAWADTNTLVSMAMASEMLRTHACICANGDVLFPTKLIHQLLRSGEDAAIAVEASRCGAEEVKVRVDDRGRILAIGKEVAVERALGEAVGVARFTPEMGGIFADVLDALGTQASLRRAYFEHALMSMAPTHRLGAVVLEDVPVIEIDFPEDLERARREIAAEMARSPLG